MGEFSKSWRLIMKEIEEKILNDIKLVFSSYYPEFLNKRITYSEPELKVLNSNTDDYSSEFSIQFKKENEFFDMFEFYIFRNGKQIVSENEIIEWLKVNIDQLLAGE